MKTTMPSARGVFLTMLFFAFAGRGIAAEPAAPPDPAMDYQIQWLEVTSAIGDIAKMTLAFNAEKPDPNALKQLTDATDQLEKAAKALLRAVPPAGDSRLHVAALPRVIEIVGASQKLLHVAESKDSAEIAASLEWLDNALLQLQKAVTAPTPSPVKSGPGAN